MPELTEAANLRRKAVNLFRRFVAAIEPWYNWGEIHVERMQGMRIGRDGYPQALGDGPVRYFELQWFGVHLQLQFGRTPPGAAYDNVAGHGASSTTPTP